MSLTMVGAIGLSVVGANGLSVVGPKTTSTSVQCQYVVFRSDSAFNKQSTS